MKKIIANALRENNLTIDHKARTITAHISRN